MKQCIDCGEHKSPNEFYKCKTTVDKLRPECKSCQKHRRVENLRLKKKNEPAYVRARTLAYKYGLTLDAFNAMIAAQENKCGICKGPKDEKKGWSVDHCHDTGKVRALLCHGCNAGLGMFRENIQSLESAIQYLRRHKWGA